MKHITLVNNLQNGIWCVIVAMLSKSIML